ncbi:hypothetical protein [Nesterenkonia sp.]|uniref:hypothetical protein n=1 Tax=Nesterenkonia sp. TaxID=704201 RepID=UPI002626CE75|nr:hypothetical protein [Nesterenkonia sp.]
MAEASDVRQASTAGIERASGISWDEWVALLDEAGAEKLKHAQIAEITYREMPEHVSSRGWWAQGVAIAYQHHKGLRIPGRSSTGDFAASASKTYPGDKDAALTRWQQVVEGQDSFGGVPLEEAPTTSATEKWRYWRAKLADGTRVAVTISDKPGGKSTVAVQHSKLASADQITTWKSVWKEVLAQL